MLSLCGFLYTKKCFNYRFFFLSFCLLLLIPISTVFIIDKAFFFLIKRRLNLLNWNSTQFSFGVFGIFYTAVCFWARSAILEVFSMTQGLLRPTELGGSKEVNIVPVCWCPRPWRVLSAGTQTVPTIQNITHKSSRILGQIQDQIRPRAEEGQTEGSACRREAL